MEIVEWVVLILSAAAMVLGSVIEMRRHRSEDRFDASRLERLTKAEASIEVLITSQAELEERVEQLETRRRSR